MLRSIFRIRQPIENEGSMNESVAMSHPIQFPSFGNQIEGDVRPILSSTALSMSYHPFNELCREQRSFEDTSSSELLSGSIGLGNELQLLVYPSFDGMRQRASNSHDRFLARFIARWTTDEETNGVVFFQASEGDVLREIWIFMSGDLERKRPPDVPAHKSVRSMVDCTGEGGYGEGLTLAETMVDGDEEEQRHVAKFVEQTEP